MSTITECVENMQKLTQQNLEILQGLNDAFFTKQEHLSVNVGDKQYAIPSFISLENKLNSLIANFNNLIHAPESGEAYFNFDGDSRAIEVKSYTETPNTIKLPERINDFHMQEKDIFKDFMTPVPYIKINTFDLPNDIVSVNIKKVIPIHPDLKNYFIDYLKEDAIDANGKPIKIDISSKKYKYSTLYKILNNYIENQDYIEYDTRMNMPIRKNIGSGIYVLEEIIKDEVDTNLDNYLTLKFRSDLQDTSLYMNELKYKLFDETIEKLLQVGDQLVTYEGNAKMEIVEVDHFANTIKVKVLHGEYLNLLPNKDEQSTISSMSKIKFFSPIDFDKDKYVKVPLEEDQYVFFAIAAINDRMNVQSSWGDGMMINTFMLKNVDNGQIFKEHYDKNVKNVGDVLHEIISLTSNFLTSKSKQEYDELRKFTPKIDTNNLEVVQINKHLDNSQDVQNIRRLHDQKNNSKQELSGIQTQITSINEMLLNIPVDSNQRGVYEDKLNDLKATQNEILINIDQVTNDILSIANNADVPIEDAKYRIRGFFDYETSLKENFINYEDLSNHVIGIKVQYRYKNSSKLQNDALTINGKFIFSDWNELKTIYRNRVPVYEYGSYKFKMSEDINNTNEPSFTQIDIPISAGETVDIRLKLVYDYGFPFVTMTSDWTPIVNIQFPKEYLNNISALDIVNENTKDLNDRSHENILQRKGVLSHVDDKITDQDITFFHKPDHIASGFYTTERRIIPLRDKLLDFDTRINELKTELFNQTNTNLDISIKHGDIITKLNQNDSVNIYMAPWNTRNKLTDLYEVIKGSSNIYDSVKTRFYIKIKNTSNSIIKLYSIFPGNINEPISTYSLSKFMTSTYIKKDEEDNIQTVWLYDERLSKLCVQNHNQFLYFSMFTGSTPYYKNPKNEEENFSENGIFLSSDKDSTIKHPTTDIDYAKVYPIISSNILLIKAGSDVYNINPQEEIEIPIECKYNNHTESSIVKTISFDIWTSVFKEPHNYSFKINFNKTSADNYAR